MGKDTKWCATLFSYASVLIILLLAPCAYGKSESSAADPQISYHVTLHSPAPNQISVQGEITSQESSKIMFERMSATLELQELQVYDHAHQKLNPIVQGDRFIISTPKGESVSFRYWIQTAPLGRHGHQGYLGKEFGLFNGSQLFLIPSLKKKYSEVTVTFTLPQGWDVTTSWKNQGGVFYPWESERLWPDSLAKSILAFGVFETRKEKNFLSLLIMASIQLIS